MLGGILISTTKIWSWNANLGGRVGIGAALALESRKDVCMQMQHSVV
jgi:hypothetical protein